MLAGVCYKTGPVEWEGRGLPRQMPALGPAQHGALWRALFTPGRATGPQRQLLKGKRSLRPYSLAMAKGFSTSILPQSAIVTSFRGLSRPSVLVLSTFRTTSWGGRQSVRSAPPGGQAPACSWEGCYPHGRNSVQTMRHQNPRGIVTGCPPESTEKPGLTTGGCRSFDPLKNHPGWARGMLGEGWGGWRMGTKWLLQESMSNWPCTTNGEAMT